MVISLSFSGCFEKENSDLEISFDSLYNNVSAVISDSTNKGLVLSELLDFEWNEVHVFKPYSTLETINEQLGFNWKDSSKSNIHESDDFNLLVFTNDQSVVNYLKWPRNMGDFLKLQKTRLTKEQSNFSFLNEKFGDQDWVFTYQLVL